MNVKYSMRLKLVIVTILLAVMHSNIILVLKETAERANNFAVKTLKRVFGHILPPVQHKDFANDQSIPVDDENWLNSWKHVQKIGSNSHQLLNIPSIDNLKGGIQQSLDDIRRLQYRRNLIAVFKGKSPDFKSTIQIGESQSQHHQVKMAKETEIAVEDDLKLFANKYTHSILDWNLTTKEEKVEEKIEAVTGIKVAEVTAIGQTMTSYINVDDARFLNKVLTTGPPAWDSPCRDGGDGKHQNQQSGKEGSLSGQGQQSGHRSCHSSSPSSVGQGQSGSEGDDDGEPPRKGGKDCRIGGCSSDPGLAGEPRLIKRINEGSQSSIEGHDLVTDARNEGTEYGGTMQQESSGNGRRSDGEELHNRRRRVGQGDGDDKPPDKRRRVEPGGVGVPESVAELDRDFNDPTNARNQINRRDDGRTNDPINNHLEEPLQSRLENWPYAGCDSEDDLYDCDTSDDVDNSIRHRRPTCVNAKPANATRSPETDHFFAVNAPNIVHENLELDADNQREEDDRSGGPPVSQIPFEETLVSKTNVGLERPWRPDPRVEQSTRGSQTPNTNRNGKQSRVEDDLRTTSNTKSTPLSPGVGNTPQLPGVGVEEPLDTGQSEPNVPEQNVNRSDPARGVISDDQLQRILRHGRAHPGPHFQELQCLPRVEAENGNRGSHNIDDRRDRVFAHPPGNYGREQRHCFSCHCPTVSFVQRLFPRDANLCLDCGRFLCHDCSERHLCLRASIGDLQEPGPSRDEDDEGSCLEDPRADPSPDNNSRDEDDEDSCLGDPRGRSKSRQ